MNDKEFIKNKYNLPDNAKLSLYRNTKEFKYFQLERINPNHKILLWGILKKKYRKTKFTSRVLAGRIQIPLIAFIFSTIYIDVNLTILILNVLCSILCAYCLFIFPVFGLNKSINFIQKIYTINKLPHGV